MSLGLFANPMIYNIIACQEQIERKTETDYQNKHVLALNSNCAEKAANHLLGPGTWKWNWGGGIKVRGIEIGHAP